MILLLQAFSWDVVLKTLERNIEKAVDVFCHVAVPSIY